MTFKVRVFDILLNNTLIVKLPYFHFFFKVASEIGRAIA